MGNTEESAYTNHAISIEVFYISGTVWHRVNHVTLELSVPAYDRTTCGGNLRIHHILQRLWQIC